MIRHNRAKAALTSRIGEVLLRRRGMLSDTPAKEKGKGFSVEGGGIISLPKGALPLSDILAKSRVLGRPPRQTEYLHVSDLIGRCVRKIAISESLKIPMKPQNISLTDALTYAQGDAIHDVVKQRVAAGGPSLVWGNWACKCGRPATAAPCLFSEVQGFVCPECKKSELLYVEVPMRDEELKIVGTPDLLTLIPEHRALHVSELKSISHDAWKDLARPIPEHVIQVVFYWFLMNRQGYRLSNRVSIGYFTKGWMFNGDPYKEFTIEATPLLDRLTPYLDDARTMHASRRGGSLPRRICASENDREARQCEMCRACFGGSENERITEVSIDQALGAPTKRRGSSRPR